MADDGKIRITFDEVENYSGQASPPPAPNYGSAGPARQWGSVAVPGAAMPMAGTATSGGFFMQAWLHLSFAGAVGAFLAWAICEPHFVDDIRKRNEWGNYTLIPLMVVMMCIGLGVVESLVERAPLKALKRGLIALILGAVLGIAFDYVANTLFRFLVGLLHGNGPTLARSPVFWMVRATAWMVYGLCGGLVYGLVGWSGKKCLYGLIGGVLGAAAGGLLFDPINMVLPAAASRMIGFTLFGASTGLAIGLVESALKDRWLYVSAGPLAGKQFILYKPLTSFGSQQSNDVYLFKDPSILPQHATIDMRGGQPILQANGATLVSGQPVSQRVLRSGDVIQIGRYAFSYQEKARSR